MGGAETEFSMAKSGASSEKKGLVFISCGQYRPEEIELGKALATAVDELTDFEGYFAQNQSSLDGLSRNIFGALNGCAGFVAVMHHRGEVQTLHGRHKRGSVWVEQEIAIAAFLRQAQDRDLQVAVYVQRDLKREGVREQLHLNPTEFDTEDEVVSDFRTRLQDGRFKPVRLPPPKNVKLELGFDTVSRGSDVHRYRLRLVATNTGTERLTEYWVELQFPKAVLAGDPTISAIKFRDTPTHVFLRATREILGVDLYPDDPVEMMPVDYYMDHDLFDGSVLGLPVAATFGAPGMSPRSIEKPLRELQEF
jgi:hypothetical protein